MKKAIEVLLATVILILGVVIICGIRSAIAKSAKDEAEREAANAAAEASEKQAAYCTELRKVTHDLKRRTARIEEMIADKRECQLTHDGQLHRHEGHLDLGEEGFKNLLTKNPSEFNWRTNLMASKCATKISAMHEKTAKRLELLDSASAYSMTALESANHENYRELFALEAELRELLVVKELKDHTLNTDDDGINEEYAKASEDLPVIRAKIRAGYGQERELLLTKIVKSIGLSKDLQTDAIRAVQQTIDATSDGSLIQNLPYLENTITNAPTLHEQLLKTALHQSCTNALTAIDAVDTRRMNANDRNIHETYRKMVVRRDTYNELYLETRINAILKRPETESVAQTLSRIQDQLDRVLRELSRDEHWFIDLKGRERDVLLRITAESLNLHGADIEYFVSTMNDLIAALDMSLL